MIEILYFPFRVILASFTKSLANPFTLILGLLIVCYVIHAVFETSVRWK